MDFYNRRFITGELDNQPFADIARAMGAEGIVVGKLEDVGPVTCHRNFEPSFQQLVVQKSRAGQSGLI